MVSGVIFIRSGWNTVTAILKFRPLCGHLLAVGSDLTGDYQNFVSSWRLSLVTSAVV